MRDNKPSLHKTLLLLILVLLPPFWLLFTEQGARVSDNALLWLLGEQDIRLDLAELDSGFTPGDIATLYPAHTWRCEPRRSALGDSLCTAQIGIFNGLPARRLIFYFGGGRLSAMKLLYRTAYHEQVISHCIASLGQPDNADKAIAEGPGTETILEWRRPGGILLLKRALDESDEPALMWIATQAVPGTPGGARHLPSAAPS